MGFGRVFLANGVKLGTGVSVDILRAMAKMFSTEIERSSLRFLILTGLCCS
jgi:hypothetical protein